MKRVSPPWFKVKRHGYGVGLPIAWQGWLILFGYVAASAVAAWLMPVLGPLVILAVLTPLLLLVAYVRSDEDWRWRNGK